MVAFPWCHRNRLVLDTICFRKTSISKGPAPGSLVARCAPCQACDVAVCLHRPHTKLIEKSVFRGCTERYRSPRRPQRLGSLVRASRGRWRRPSDLQIRQSSKNQDLGPIWVVICSVRLPCTVSHSAVDLHRPHTTSREKSVFRG